MDHNIHVDAMGTLTFLGRQYRCALGRGGVSSEKTEGDGATPKGCFPIRCVFYRPDKLDVVVTHVPVMALIGSSAWCDDPSDTRYNTYIAHATSVSHERLWREDDLYDIIVVLGHNDAPPVPGKGSAIFMHVGRETYTSTEGCITLSRADLLEVVAGILPTTKVCVHSSGL